MSSTSPTEVPSFISDSAPLIQERITRLTEIAPFAGRLVVETERYRPLTDEEQQNQIWLEPVLEEHFRIPYVHSRTLGVGAQLKHERNMQDGQKSMISLGYNVQGRFHSAQRPHRYHDEVTDYNIYVNGTIHRFQGRSSLEDQDRAPIDPRTGLKVYESGVRRLFASIKDMDIGLDVLNQEEVGRLRLALTELGWVTDNSDELDAFVKATTDNEGVKTSSLNITIPTQDSESYYPSDLNEAPGFHFSSKQYPDGSSQLQVETNGRKKLVVELDSVGSVTLAELYPVSDAIILEEIIDKDRKRRETERKLDGFEIFSPSSTIEAYSLRANMARDQERAIGLLVPNEPEFNFYLGRLTQAINASEKFIS